MKQTTLFDIPQHYDQPPVAGLSAATLEASQAAAERVEPDAESLRGLVLAHIRGCGARGATDAEMQDALEMRGDTQRPRRWELWKANLITEAGHRLNRQQRKCTVWIAL